MKTIRHYEVTIQYIRAGRFQTRSGTTPLEEETFKVSTDVPIEFSEDTGMSPRIQEFRFVKAKFWSNGEILNGDEIRGMACVCPSIEAINIERFIDRVSNVGVAAVVIATDAAEVDSEDVPVIRLPRPHVRKLHRWAVTGMVVEEVDMVQQPNNSTKLNTKATSEESDGNNNNNNNNNNNGPDSDVSVESVEVDMRSPDDITRKGTMATESSSINTVSNQSSSEDDSTDKSRSRGTEIDGNDGCTSGCVDVLEEEADRSTTIYSGPPTYANVARASSTSAVQDTTGNRGQSGAATGPIRMAPRHLESTYEEEEGHDDRGVHHQKRKSSSGGLFSAVKGAITSATTTITEAANTTTSYILGGKKKSQSELIRIFNKKEWSQKQNFKGYKDAIKLVHQRWRWRQTDTIQEVTDWLFCHNNGQLRLVVCMELWMMAQQSEQKQALFNAIIRFIGCLSQKGKRNVRLKDIHAQFYRQDEKPHLIALKFFKEMVKLPVITTSPSKDDEAYVDFWIAVFLLWDDCGLLTPKKIQWVDWDMISKHVDKNFACRHEAKLSELIDQNRVQTISLFLQRNASCLYQAANELQAMPEIQGKSKAYLEPQVGDLVIKVCENLVDEALDKRPSDYQEWTSIFQTLSARVFKPPFSEPQLLQKIVELISFRKCNSLKLYHTIYKASNGTELEKKIWELLCGEFQYDLQSATISFCAQLASLLELKVGSRFLQEEVLFEGVVSHAKMAVGYRSVSFSDKLILISAIQMQLNQAEQEPSRQMSQLQGRYEDGFFGTLMAEACQGHTCREILLESFAWATKANYTFKGLLVSGHADKMTEWIVASLFCYDIVSCLHTTREIAVMLQLDSKELSFESCLSKKLQDALVGECLSMERAAKILDGLGFADISDYPYAKFVEGIFSESFEAWKPKSLTSLGSLGRDTDKFWSHCLRNKEAETQTGKLRECLRTLLGDWLSNYQIGSVGQDGLKLGLICSALETWAAVDSLRLPTAEGIQITLDRWEQLTTSIKQALEAPPEWKYSLTEVLSAYNWNENSASEFGRILALYGPTLMKVENSLHSKLPMDAELADRPNAEKVLTLSQLETDTASAALIRSKFWPAISTCEHFLQHKSFIFDGTIRPFLDEAVDLSELKRSVECTRDSIKSLFESEGSFSAVVSTLRTCPTEPAALEAECNALLTSSTLGLSKVEVDQFLTAACMHRMEAPLHDFLRCCEQFKFSAIRDNLFAQLKDLHAALESSTQSSVGSMCQKSHVLLALFWPDVAWEVQEKYTASDIRAEIAGCEDIFRMFGRFGYHSEVWAFAREMKWFGKEGLDRFYKEHEHVTNVLLGNTSESYYMSILDALEPTMRVISALGGLLTEPRVLNLLDAVVKNSDIKTWQTAANSNLQQVQSSLSLLRRWFCDGVDEIAGLQSLFRAVKKTGKYVVFSASELGIVYSIDGHNKTLAGKDLLNFIEQAGMIQQEGSSGDSLSIEGFLEQHELLQKAFCNFLDCVDVGYALKEFKSFSCLAGGQHLDEANEIFKKSQLYLNQKNQWVASVRSRFPASLLFWMEELKEIHPWIVSRPSKLDLQRLSGKLLRLNPKVSSELLIKTIHQCLRVTIKRKTHWFETTSAFVQSVYEGVAEPQTQNKAGGLVVLHAISTAATFVEEAVLDVMQHIYPDCLPEDYQVLDGLAPCSVAKVDLFLQRVKTFTSATFTIVNVDELNGKNQEQVLDFLSDRDNESCGVQLHCIQRRSTILHTSAFVEGKNWDDSLIQSLSPCWKPHIVSGNHIKKASVVVSDLCGAGKTRYIRSEIQQLDQNGEGVETGSIIIHEGSSEDSLTTDVLGLFTENGGPKAVHFSFMWMPTSSQSKLKQKWLQSINRFFYSLLVHGVLRNDTSSRSFHIGRGGWSVFVELPSSQHQYGQATNAAFEWLRIHIPVLALCAKIITPRKELAIDAPTRRVATYLRALENGTIDRKFQQGSGSKRIIFVLDRSGSMGVTLDNGQSALDIATDCALQIFDSHLQPNDMVGVLLFNNVTSTRVQIQAIAGDAHKTTLRGHLSQVRNMAGGGTNMYPALHTAVETSEMFQDDIETWVVCLTDGVTDGTDASFRPLLQGSSDNLHVILIGVNLHSSYQAQMRLLCSKYQTGATTTKGFFVPSQANLASLQNAFQAAARSIPVSQTFELDGRVSDSECRRLIQQCAPESIPNDNMQLLTTWCRFLYRRVSVLDANKDFNYNEEFEHLGSTLMETMLFEAARLVGTDLCQDWIQTNHTQLIYDFTKPDPEFRLLCSSPSNLDSNARQRYESLKLPGFFVPTEAQLKNTSILCQYLSQALDIPVSGGECLACINKNRFVLTLDFTIKMLCLNERVACGIPSIMEGETGVSKTALTKMYSILKNLSTSLDAEASTNEDIADIEEELQSLGHQMGEADCGVSRIEAAVRSAAATFRGESNDLSSQLYGILSTKCTQRSAIFRSPPKEFSDDKTETVLKMLQWFASSELEQTFFEINVDASLTDQDIFTLLEPVRTTARKLRNEGCMVVVFFDEINTSSVLGSFKEIVVDHTFRGKRLEDNIVAVAACNPARAATFANSAGSRARDLGSCWASGHYQVEPLPPSMEQLKWHFGSLKPEQEREFVSRRLEMMGSHLIPPGQRLALTDVICTSQESIRRIAERHMNETAAASVGEGDNMQLEAEDIRQRATSVVSLRDIQRVFSLFQFFAHEFQPVANLRESTSSRCRKAMLLAVAVVYYLRLDAQGRDEFFALLKALPSQRREKDDLQQVLNTTMQTVIEATIVPAGIAVTRGLTENLFMTLVCLLSRTPLMIVGPPGSSKTLSVNMLADNANGEDSLDPLYRQFARLSLYHYQCSKESTSKEIASVFEKASQRQEKADASKQRCCVFMDEAGLPEEERESLKVLHYLLEGHMSMKAPVGFVAITNHILDAAKSNRCAVLLRPEPDAKEMLTIAKGLLFKKGVDSTLITQEVDLGGQVLGADNFAIGLCNCYSRLIHEGVDGVERLDTFFGLRDFIYLLKALKFSSTELTTTKMGMPLLSFVQALERNFNGLNLQSMIEIVALFLSCFSSQPKEQLRTMVANLLRGQMDVIADALASNKAVGDLESRARFKLIIDCSEDDSIMRLLHLTGLLDVSKKSLFKLSHMEEDFALEKLRLISGVKFAAGQGGTALLSQTDPVNESFYDLFNQHFRTVVGRDGKVQLFANIAVGGVSRRSLVHPEFECIVHVRESQLQELPAPFLNRFEKYRLDVADVLMAGWSKLGRLACVMQRARAQTEILLDPLLKDHGLFGLVNPKRTLDSIFVDLLPPWALTTEARCPPKFAVNESDPFLVSISKFLAVVMSVEMEALDLLELLDGCKASMGQDERDLLQHLTSAEARTSNQELQDVLNGLSSEGSGEDSPLDMLCQSTLQMAVTKQAVCALLQLARPEAVYSTQHALPRDILNGFLAQGNSSLKQLIEKEMPHLQEHSGLKMILAYTRTDAFNICLQTLSANQDMALLGLDNLEKIKGLVCENVEDVIIERLESLRSERKLQNSMVAWAQHPTKRLFVLLVDMNESKAMDRCNYIRMCAEQHAHNTPNKLFVLLLHYHPSTSLKSDCYPALILGGWRHVFLDGVGQLGPEMGINQWMRMACQDVAKEDNDMVGLLVDFLIELLPNILSHIACKPVLHPEQLAKMPTAEGGLFSQQCAALQALSSRGLGGQTIGQTLCKKFAMEWRNHTLPKVAELASRGLLEGTTQLSMGTAIQSTFVKTFEAFVMLSFLEMNKDQNLNVLEEGNKNVVEELFGLILESVPVVPFEEILLQYDSIHHRQQRSAALMETAQFPFFAMVSSCIDECLEEVEKKVVDTHKERLDGSIQNHLFTPAMELVNETMSSNDKAHLRPKAFLQAIQFVFQDSTGQLFKLYLSQFIEHRTGCSSDEVATEWLEREVGKVCGERNILAIHCVERHRQIDFMRLVSWSSTIQKQLPSIGMDVLAVIDFEGFHQGSFINTLFDGLLTCIQEKLIESLDGGSEWSKFMSSFLAQVSTGFVPREVLMKEDTQDKLRIFLVFHVLSHVPARKLHRSVFQKWYDFEQLQVRTQDKSNLSLKHVLAVVGDCQRRKEFVVGSFFSPTAMNCLPSFLTKDLHSLIDLVESGDVSSHFAATVLQSACWNASVTKHEGSLGGMADEALRIVNSRLQCRFNGPMSVGGRMKMAHFIPPWLRLPAQLGHAHQTCSQKQKTNLYPEFFADYQHSFDGKLAAVAFDMVLGVLLQESCSLSSSDLLQHLAQDIEAALDMSNNMFESLAAGDQQSPLGGSRLGAIVVDARVICFVAKVAQELGEEATAAALSGPEGELGAMILEQIMCLSGACFKEFFFKLIVHHSGDASLAALLRPGGQLHEFSWCGPLQKGLPSHRESIELALKDAEKQLAEARQEEQRKENEIRLCPNCQAQFVVDQANCGTFYCGRDAHGVNGAPAIGGRAVNQVYGCNSQFRLDAAGRYQVDQSVLAPLQSEVSRKRTEYHDAESSKSNWSAVFDFELPTLFFSVEQGVVRGPVPSAALMGDRRLSDDQRHHLQILVDGSDFRNELSALPDLIEFYIWINETFRHLMTREQALSTTMGNLMKGEHLLKRFDRVHVSHLLSLWGRVSGKINELLDDPSRKVFWNCQEVELGFDSVEEAPLISLLSEGSCPEDGNDFLFLFINGIINKYNRYVERLSELGGSRHPDANLERAAAIHPKTILGGSAGSIAVNLVPLLPKSRVDALSKAAWGGVSKAFDLERLDSLLTETTFHKELAPLISNPEKFLREQFLFREEDRGCKASRSGSGLVFAISGGLCFAREQDFKLAVRAKHTLKRIGMNKRDHGISGPIKVNFQSLDSHQKVSSLLEGLCNLCDLMLAEGHTTFQGMPEIMNAMHQQNPLGILGKMGFPELSLSQWRLLRSLNPEQVVELTHFLTYQLAVEGYLHAKFDLCVTDPIKEDHSAVISSKVEALCSRQGAEIVLEQVISFLEDILGHYKREICKEALKQATLLQHFLVKNMNAIDETDSFLRCLPREITVRNYVSLLQVLHQVKLSLLMKTAQPRNQAPTTDTLPGQEGDPCNASNCWLWGGENFKSLELGHVKDVNSAVMEELWFASAETVEESVKEAVIEKPVGSHKESELEKEKEVLYPRVDKDSMDCDCASHSDDEMQLEPCTSEPETTMAVKHNMALFIQQWWRFQHKQRLLHLLMLQSVDDESLEERGSMSSIVCMGETLEHEDNDHCMAAEEESFETASNFSRNERTLRENDSAAMQQDMVFDDASTVLAWSKEAGLSRLAADQLVQFGACNLEDIQMVVYNIELLTTLPKLDQLKLKDVFGCPPDELRSWLDEHSLSPDVEEHLRELGVSTIEDVYMIVSECEDMLEGLKKLDRYKLKRAFKE